MATMQSDQGVSNGPALGEIHFDGVQYVTGNENNHGDVPQYCGPHRTWDFCSQVARDNAAPWLRATDPNVGSTTPASSPNVSIQTLTQHESSLDLAEADAGSDQSSHHTTMQAEDGSPSKHGRSSSLDAGLAQSSIVSQHSRSNSLDSVPLQLGIASQHSRSNSLDSAPQPSNQHSRSNSLDTVPPQNGVSLQHSRSNSLDAVSPQNGIASQHSRANSLDGVSPQNNQHNRANGNDGGLPQNGATSQHSRSNSLDVIQSPNGVASQHSPSNNTNTGSPQSRVASQYNALNSPDAASPQITISSPHSRTNGLDTAPPQYEPSTQHDGASGSSIYDVAPPPYAVATQQTPPNTLSGTTIAPSQFHPLHTAENHQMYLDMANRAFNTVLMGPIRPSAPGPSRRLYQQRRPAPVYQQRGYARQPSAPGPEPILPIPRPVARFLVANLTPPEVLPDFLAEMGIHRARYPNRALTSNMSTASNASTNTLVSNASFSEQPQPGMSLDRSMMIIKNLDPNPDDTDMNGGVFLVKNTRTDRTYVEKRLRITNAQQYSRTIKEIEVLRCILQNGSMQYLNRIHTEFWAHDMQLCAITLEYCELGSLQGQIDMFRRNNHLFTDDFLFRCFSHIANALTFLHFGVTDINHPPQPPPRWNYMLHLDVKPANIFLKLINEVEPCFVLGDFGCVVTGRDITAGRAHRFEQPHGTNGWFPPESGASHLFRGDRRPFYGKPTDVWNLGAVIQCASHLANFPNQDVVDSRTPLPPRYANFLKREVTRCMQRNYTNRPTVIELAGVLKNEMTRRGIR